jgi:protein TonB
VRLRIGSSAVIVTAVLHGGLAAGIATIRRVEPQPPTVITIVDTPRKQPPKPPQPPPPSPTAPAAPTVKPAPAQPRPAPAPHRSAPPAATTATPAAPPEFGVQLGGPSGDGPALPAAASPAAPVPPVERKALHAQPTAAGACIDPITKPKPIHVVQPAFTQAAQDANITGKVRVEITISATGEVTGVRVIEGLGYGLDEAALEAAHASTFQPATRCGEPVATTFTIGMRFTR